ncbi:MAG: hypothetical protein CML13_13765 [Puniceicoccaceae bacterium]|nr:hypothetical protein [Puniceicoccaceae bacterium]
MKENVIAQIDLELLSPADGKRERIQLTIESPEREDEAHWYCIVTDPKNKEKMKVYGTDSLQCLTLGMSHIGRRMNALKNEGFRWIYADTNDDFPIAAYFPSSIESQIKAG